MTPGALTLKMVLHQMFTFLYTLDFESCQWAPLGYGLSAILRLGSEGEGQATIVESLEESRVRNGVESFVEVY